AQRAEELPSLEAFRFRGIWLSAYAPVGEGGLPDVLALLTGAADPCPDPAVPCALPPETETVLDQLVDQGRTWRAYVEDDSATATPGDPFPALPALADAPEVVPLAELAQPPKPAPDPANLTLLLPGLAKLDPAVADAWLTETLAALDAQIVLVQLADGALLIAPEAASGTEDDAPLDAFSLLRTIEDLFGLPTLGEAEKAEPLPWSQELHGDPTGS
ncbi:MAG TPA: hypothetical protein VIL49_12760, partial [Capillimicrobium sp.]